MHVENKNLHSNLFCCHVHHYKYEVLVPGKNRRKQSSNRTEYHIQPHQQVVWVPTIHRTQSWKSVTNYAQYGWCILRNCCTLAGQMDGVLEFCTFIKVGQLAAGITLCPRSRADDGFSVTCCLFCKSGKEQNNRIIAILRSWLR